MGSVLSDIDCPRCGQSATEDYYYKTDEVYIMCSYCGYYYNKRVITKKGKAVVDEYGEWLYDIKEKFPYGICTITLNSNKIQMLTLEEEDDVKVIEDMVKTKKMGIDNIVISYFNGQEIVTKEIIAPKGKRIFSPEDPFGEEDWED